MARGPRLLSLRVSRTSRAAHISKMSAIKPLPKLPENLGDQPTIVAALDDIRFTIEDDDRAEFAWFAREYPRIFRYHIYHAEHRLKTIHENYRKAASEFELQTAENENLFSVSSGRGLAWQIYWDFEAFLNAVGSALDVLARIVGLFYTDPVPLSFSKLCSKRQLSGAVDLLRSAQHLWVHRLKDYRDCFVHYTPVDNEAWIHCHKYRDGWEIRCAIPVNPNIRETEGFRFSRRAELLRYSIATHKRVMTLDRHVGQLIRKHWAAGTFPKRFHNLFFVGERQRVLANNRLETDLRTGSRSSPASAAQP
jgi:hypothetical protein